MTRETARTALEALWAAMVELTEAGHDLIVLGQARIDANSASRVEALAAELAQLAPAAAVLARAAGAP